MNLFKCRIGGWIVALGCLGVTSGFAQDRAEAAAPETGYYLSVGGGWLDVEGDEPIGDAAILSLRLGRDFSAYWAAELGLDWAPDLPENFRTDRTTGRRVSRLEEEAGVEDTAAFRLILDALFHPLGRATVDPYLTLGLGAVRYADSFDQEYEGFAQAGAGCFIHFTPNWALRADARALVAGQDTECNSSYTLGLTFRPGGEADDRTAPSRMDTAPAAERDTDGDGLPDSEEARLKTDPLLVDTDWDALSDGDEIRRFKTDPLKRDTDGGGVYDGHEVLEDATDPRQGNDDLQFFELRLMFDAKGWRIPSEYRSEIGVIGKILRDDPGATARIEGHLDALAHPSARRAQTLSARRAEAVKSILIDDWQISEKRLTDVGYGATRPKGPSRPDAAHPENERIEIYIRRTTPWR